MKFDETSVRKNLEKGHIGTQMCKLVQPPWRHF